MFLVLHTVDDMISALALVVEDFLAKVGLCILARINSPRNLSKPS